MRPRPLTEKDCEIAKQIEAAKIESFGCYVTPDGKPGLCYWLNEKKFPFRCDLLKMSLFLAPGCPWEAIRAMK